MTGFLPKSTLYKVQILYFLLGQDVVKLRSRSTPGANSVLHNCVLSLVWVEQCMEHGINNKGEQ